MSRQKTVNRERSAADTNPVEAEKKGIQGGDPRDPNRDMKRKRVSLQQTGNLDIVGVELDQENYYYRWFAEKKDRATGRVRNAEAAFYEFVTDDQGNHVTRPSGEDTLYLMRLPMEYHLEDMQAKRDKNERQLMDEAGLKGNEYAPSKKNREGGDSSFVDRTQSDNPYA